AEADLSAGVAVVLVVDGCPPHVEAAADVVPAPRQRDVRLDGIDSVRAWTEAAREVLELVDVDAWKETAHSRCRELRHETRRPYLAFIVAKRVIGTAALEVIRVAAPKVEHGAGTHDVDPVADQRPVGANERELTVLHRTGANRGGVAHLVARVLTPAEEHPILRTKVVIDLADPVPEQILVEVLGVREVLLPRRDTRRRRVLQRII